MDSARSRAGSPDRNYAILLKPAILGDQWHPLHNGLRHQNTVERIVVQFGKMPERHHVRCPNRKCGNARLAYVFRPPWERILEQSVFLPLFKISSQRLATLTVTPDSASTRLAGALSKSGSESAQTSACVSARTLTAPQCSRRLPRQSWAATSRRREARAGLAGRCRVAVQSYGRGPTPPQAFRPGQSRRFRPPRRVRAAGRAGS